MGSTSTLLHQQIEYYQARSGEYDQWFLRQGRYDHGPELNGQWFDEVDQLRQVLNASQPAGHILELACGTGIWTEQLLPHATSLTAVDASPGMLDGNRKRLGADKVTYIQADLFEWKSERTFDLVFMGFWLSHVPEARFESFWSGLQACLNPGGRVLFFDSQRSETSRARDHVCPNDGEISHRRLNDGREFDVVKVFYQPSQLVVRLAALGWESKVGATPNYFIFGNASRSTDS